MPYFIKPDCAVQVVSIGPEFQADIPDLVTSPKGISGLSFDLFMVSLTVPVLVCMLAGLL